MNRIIASIIAAAGVATTGCVDGPSQRMHQTVSPSPNRIMTDSTRLQTKLDATEQRTVDGGDAAIVKHELYLEQRDVLKAKDMDSGK